MIARATLVALVAAFLALPASAQLGLPGLYAGASEGQVATYSLKISTGDTTHEYDVTYTLESKGVLSVEILTDRRLIRGGKPMKEGRKLKTRFRFAKSLGKQLVENKKAENWKKLKVAEMKLMGDETLKIGGTDYACKKISFKYSGMIDNIEVSAEEVIWYCEKIKVHRIAKSLGTYKLGLASGEVTQKLELICVKN